MFGFLQRRRAREARASIESPTVPISSPNLLEFLGLTGGNAAGELVTIETALGVPAVWAAVNFIPATIASLPLNLYQRGPKGGRNKLTATPLALILHETVNDEMSSFEWRKGLMTDAVTGGRGLSYIERNKAGGVLNIWPLDPERTVVRRVAGHRIYDYTSTSKTLHYDAADVIDIPMMLRSDGLRHRSPILANRDVIGMAQAVTKYGGRFFANGAVPPFAITGAFQSGAAMKRAADDLEKSVKKAALEKRQALVLPQGLEIKPIGADPEKAQMIDVQRFMVEQIARIWSLPPVFLQDLTHGTFSNSEQQDLQFVKHTIRRWVVQIEQELNLKLFGRGPHNEFVEFNLDGLLRGDYLTRMEGNAKAVQTGQLTPNEARKMENRPNMNGGDQLFIQGATVPIVDQPALVPLPPKKGPGNAGA